MKMIGIVVGSLALAGCAGISPFAGIGVGTSIGNLHLGTGVSVNPFEFLGGFGRPDAPRRLPAAVPPRRLTPIREYSGPAGRPCRDFYEDRVVSSRVERGYGTACLQADGSWQIVALR
jgi:hypothetical protein